MWKTPKFMWKTPMQGKTTGPFTTALELHYSTIIKWAQLSFYLQLKTWKIQLLVDTRMAKSRIHEGFGFVAIKGSF